MKEIKLRINRLGAVRDSVISITPLTILSGESGLGKSYVALLMHYIYALIEQSRFDTLFERNNISVETAFKNEKSKFSIPSSAITAWINEDATKYMREAIGNPKLEIDVEIDIPLEHKYYTYDCSTEIIGIAGKEEIYYTISLNGGLPYRYSQSSRILGSSPFSILLSTALEVELGINSTEFKMQAFLMVPGRGSILNLNRDDKTLLEKQSGMIEEFLRDWDVIKHMAPQKISAANIALEKRIQAINGGNIVIEDDELKYAVKDLIHPLPISAAASSVKELAPLAMLIEKYPVNALSILFEEPEAHLHPTKQIEIADFIAEAVSNGTHFQITTHSDYFIRRINDLIFLHKLKGKDSAMYEYICEKGNYPTLTINPDVVSAYLLEQNNITGRVQVKKQDLTCGIPFESFYSVLQNNVKWSMELKNKYKELYENEKRAIKEN